MITADTITDEQIRALREVLSKDLARIQRQVMDCTRAMGSGVKLFPAARARCAAILNAREAKP